MITPPTADRIKRATDLISLVQEYVELRRMGPRWVGRCPFHKERTASFGVNQHWFKCFGCGAGGDCFRFYQLIEGVGFHSAAKTLAARAGIPLDGKPITRAQVAYAKEEAAFCGWWWRNRREILKAHLDEALQKDDFWLAMGLGRAWRWSPPRKEAFAFFRENHTAEERWQWEAEKTAWEGLWHRISLATWPLGGGQNLQKN